MQKSQVLSETKARWIVFLFIQLLYFSYRFYYWRDSLAEDYAQVVSNSLLDGLMVFGLYLLMGPLSRKFRENRIIFFIIWFILGSLASVAMTFVHFLVYQFTGGMDEQFHRTFMLIGFQIFDSYVVIFVGLGISTAFRWYYEWSTASIRLSELEKEKAETELAYLKSQINPHFVFNTLNSIYFLIKPENEQARNALQTFSEMLRYQLYESSYERVPINEELKYLKNYIRLQRMRLDSEYLIQEDIDSNMKGYLIPPLLLIIPLENAFKYVSHHADGKANEILIRATKERESLVFTYENTCSEQEIPLENGGIGLQNLRRRMELIYGDRAKIKIEREPGRYRLELILPL
ncbi:MAG: hypothetical protein GC180_11555 [Bacteroidetes bacterium]|nr:hypothetical protein [Bacteroidota bacterium]